MQQRILEMIKSNDKEIILLGMTLLHQQSLGFVVDFLNRYGEEDTFPSLTYRWSYVSRCVITLSRRIGVHYYYMGGRYYLYVSIELMLIEFGKGVDIEEYTRGFTTYYK